MGKRHRRWRQASAVEDVVARAARLGITPERVLQEYARIAFSNMRHLAEWGPGEDGMTVKPSSGLDEADVAAVAEIVASASTGKIYRIKLHDKKPVLDAIARHLGMLPKTPTGPDDDELAQEEGEDPRVELERRLARLAASLEEEGISRVPPDGTRVC